MMLKMDQIKLTLHFLHLQGNFAVGQATLTHSLNGIPGVSSQV